MMLCLAKEAFGTGRIALSDLDEETTKTHKLKLEE
jgi:hypothetical protein